MASKLIAIRTDASSEIGTGHFMRCLTLADELKKNDCYVCFVARELPAYLRQMLKIRNIHLYSLEQTTEDKIDDLPHSKWLKVSQYQDAKETLQVLSKHKFDWLVVDHYSIDYRWESLLRRAVKKIMVIDDLADRQHFCDVLLDQNYYHDKDERYITKVPKSCKLLLGPSYALLRDEFREQRKNVTLRDGNIKNLLIYFGGVDSKNYTALAINSLIPKKWSLVVDVVIGKHHPNIQEILDNCKINGFACHIQTEKMAELMAKSDLALCAGGTSLWELFTMGVPSICISTASNQNKQIIDLQNSGLVISSHKNQEEVEFFRKALEIASSDKVMMKMISKKIYEMVDGNGASKVGNLIVQPDIKMRLANQSDCYNLFKWRNHSTIRDNSISANEISLPEHEKWFDQRSGKASQPILIGETKRKPVGVVRFDITDDIADVSIYLVPDSGSSGLGRSLLTQAESWLKEHHPKLSFLRAKVLAKNTPSKKLFLSLEYVQKNAATEIEFLKKLYE
jgi:UDP-2,4-diacetamido-2,4,6-trideoxy-beta-L-altropyranose hydrolase